MTTFRTILFLLCALVVDVSVGYAQTKIWTGAVDSSWHDPGNWSPAGVPTATQVVTLRNNTTPYPVITTNVTIRSITINDWYSNPGDQLRIRNNATLIITDDFTINGAGVLNIINGHVEMTATTGGQNNFDMNSDPTINITNGSFTAGTASEDVDVDIDGFLNLGDGDFTVFGDFNVLNGSEVDVENGTVIVNGNTEINGTYNGDDGTTTFNDAFEVRSGGVINLDTGTINFEDATDVRSNGTANFGSGEVNFASDIEVRSSGFFNVEDATVTVTGNAEFRSNGNLSIDNGTINITGNASLSSGGDFDLNDGNLNIGGDASFTSGGTLNADNSTITLEGDFTVQNQSNFNADSSTVVFAGDSTQTVTSNSDITFFNVQVDSGAVFNTDGGNSNTVVVEGDLVVNDGGGVSVEGDDQLDVQGDLSGGGADNVESPNPLVVSVTAPAVDTVLIRFSKAMDETLAENLANYSIVRFSNNNAVTISSATLNTGNDSTLVTLVVNILIEDVVYEITINNLESADGGVLSANHKNRFTKTGPVTFYSRQNGDWDQNTTWSRVSHTGSAASSSPDAFTGATIIVGGNDMVTVTSTSSVSSQNSVEVIAGATLRVGTGGIFTTGSLVITGTGTFEVSSGTLQIGSPDGISASGATGNIQTTTRIFSTTGSYEYNAGSSQITGNGLPNTVDDLNIDNSAGVRTDQDLEVTGTLFLDSGSFTIRSGNNLIANTKVVTSGDLIMEQTITGSAGWRLLSTPLSTDYDDLLDSIVTQGYAGAFYSTGSNPGDSLQPNVLFYDETYPGTDNQRWRAPVNASDTIPSARGLYTFIFGDITGDTRYNNTLPLTLTARGSEPDGPVDMDITYTTAADSGWNLVGNPYMAGIDWDDGASWTKTNVDNTIYVWDYTTNQYLTWNGTVGSLGNGRIAPFQGFWIKANGASPSLIVTEDAKTTGGSFVGKAIPNENRYQEIYFSIELADDKHRSATHFMFSEDAKRGKDPDDGFKLLPLPGIGDYLEFSSLTNTGDKLSINNLPRDFGIPIEVPLHVEAYSAGYSVDRPLNLSFSNFENIPSHWVIYLLDTVTGKEIPVTDGSIYPFQYHGVHGKIAPNSNATQQPKVSSKAKISESRFLLRIEPGMDASGLPDTFGMPQNYPNPFNPTTNIQFTLPVQSQAQLMIFDLLGRQVATLVNGELNAGTHQYTWDASSAASGIYIYRLITERGVFTGRMTLLK